jgi:cytochrome P450
MSTGSFDINLQDQAVIDDPFPVYEQIRAAGRVVPNGLLGVTMVPNYSDVLDVLHDTTTFSSRFYDPANAPSFFEGANTMIDTDPPDHTRLRKVAQKAFLRSGIAKLDAAIHQVVDGLLDDPALKAQLDAGQEIEIMEAFCRPVPASVIAILLGVPLSDLSQFAAWSHQLGEAAGVGRESLPDWPDVFARAEEAGGSMRLYLKDQLERHREEKHDDLLNDLLVANGEGTLTDGELIATCILLMIAGNETTTKLIGAGLRLLDSFPDQRRQLAEDPDLMTAAVEEMLRYEGVTHLQGRLVTADTEFAGESVKAGEIILVMFGAANRDPQAFEDPGRFDIRRRDNYHVGFGHGIHHCLGATLARTESRIALRAFLQRWPEYHTGDFQFGPVLLARGLDSLKLTVDA